MVPDPKLFAAQAQNLKAQGRLNEAIGLFRQAVAAAPGSASAEHNLAAALGDAGRWAEAEGHMNAAFAKGATAPESWLVLARCLQARGAFDEAERAFLSALGKRPSFHDAHLDLAQLRWMRTGDSTTALAVIEQALSNAPGDPQLALAKARIMENTGRGDEAFRLAKTLAHGLPDNLSLAVYTSQRAAELGDVAEARLHAERALSLAPNDNVAAATLISAHLAAGEPRQAESHAIDLVRRAPRDQHAIALLATAWRLLGDARYHALYDYDALVQTSLLEAPPGWTSLTAYLDDLRETLRQGHVAVTHPFNQSVRHGSQISDILGIDAPAIAALPAALAPSITRYLAKLGAGTDPLRQRNLGGYAYQGMWSIRMHAGGYHVDHVHPNGWLSSACYIEAPVATENNEGWIRFGASGIRTSPALAPDHLIEPKPGMLVLFPSYMWHGVIPYSTPAARMTVAFDLEPSDGIPGGP